MSLYQSYVYRFGILSIIFVLTTGCTHVTKFRLDNKLTYSANGTIPLRAALFIADSSRNLQYEAVEKSLGTYIYKTPIGQYLEPNALRALSPVFLSVTVVSDTLHLADSIEALIILKFNNFGYAWWSQGGGIHRKFTVGLNGTIRTLKTHNELTFTSEGLCHCNKYKCEIKGEFKGMSSGLALLTMAVGGAGAVAGNIKNIYKNGTGSSLQQAIDGFSNTVVLNKDKLLQ